MSKTKYNMGGRDNQIAAPLKEKRCAACSQASALQQAGPRGVVCLLPALHAMLLGTGIAPALLGSSARGSLLGGAPVVHGTDVTSLQKC